MEIRDESDAGLLGRYAASRCEAAFAELVGRYLPLIYSAAVRQVRDRHLAEDVAQATLVILSRKAGRVDPALLPGWLMTTTRYAASEAMRRESRRVRHERRAAGMADESRDAAAVQAVSEEIDRALARLSDADRTAVVLRYFRGESFAGIAARLDITEGAAQRRIARAVDELRRILAGRGVAIGEGAFTAALVGQVAHPVPSALAGRVMSAASSSKGAASSVVVKGVLRAMATVKLKVGIAVGLAVVLAGAAVPAVHHLRPARERPVVVAAAGVDWSRPVVGSLPPGMEVEPLAVMRLAGGRWVTPGGAAVAGLPGAAGALMGRVRADRATHAFLFRLVSPGNDVDWSYELHGAAAYDFAQSYDARSKTHYALIVFVPVAGAGEASLSLMVRAAAGPWGTGVVVPASAREAVSGTIGGATVSFSPPRDDGNEVHLVYMMVGDVPASVRETCVRFCAIDLAGRRVTESTEQDKRVDFAGSLSGFREFRMETRPYNYHATYAAVRLAGSK